MRKFLGVIGLLLALGGIAGCANPIGGDGKNGFLPENGEFPGLVSQGAVLSASNKKNKEKYLGRERAAFFEQHSLEEIHTRDYTLNGERLTLEAFELNSPAGASGIYYYYAGRQLRGVGKELEVGAQAVLDTLNKNRNLYFYKGKWFFSIIYTGKEPTPDLTPLARFMAARVPGESSRPEGMDFLQVEGVAGNYAKVTPGNALNFDIFPPGVFTLAPAGGSRAAAYIISFSDRDRVETRTMDFKRYLQVNAADFRQESQAFGKERVTFYRALDGRHGKLVFVSYGRHIIIIAQLDDYQPGIVIAGRIVEKIKASRQQSGEGGFWFHRD